MSSLSFQLFLLSNIEVLTLRCSVALMNFFSAGALMNLLTFILLVVELSTNEEERMQKFGYKNN
jgi:hypothetical protein